MPVDAGGNATRPTSPVPVSGQTADAPQVNVPINDIYAILNMLVFLDGRKSLRGNIPMNGHRARGAADAELPQDYVTLAQLQSLVGESGVPTGSIQSYTISSTTAPAGWVFANGQTLSRATFPRLWDAVQSGNNLAASEVSKQAGQYGPGNGTTTFTVPNLTTGNGQFIRSTMTGRGIGTVQPDDLKSHTHSGTTEGGGEHNHTYQRGAAGFGDVGAGSYTGSAGTYSTSTAPNHTHTFTTNSTGGTETRPNNVAYPFIIKT